MLNKIRLKKILGLLFFSVLLFVIVANYAVEKTAQNRIYSNVEQIPYNKVGLVLGTSKYLRNGQLNAYFYFRVKAAADLYKHHKIDFILVSGDNGATTYNEPEDFKNALIEQGVPADKIYLDFAGFRTLDSVVRAKEIFGQEKFTIISQKFHNARAVFLAKHFNIDAIGFNAKDVNNFGGLKTKLREYLARAKALWDIFWGVQPKFGGKPIKIA